MWGNGDLRQLKERRISAWFRSKNIESRTSVMPLFDRLGQGLLIHQSAASRINENLPLLRLNQKLLIKHSGSLWGLRKVNGHKIGTRHELFQFDQFHAQCRRTSRVGIGVVGNDGRFKRLQTLCEELTNVSKTNNTDGLSIYLHALERRTLPFPLAQRLVGCWYLTRRRQEQCNGLFARRVNIRRRCIYHHDALFRCRRNINVI